MDQAAQERASGEHHGARGDAVALGRKDSSHHVAVDSEILDRGLDHFEVGCGCDRRLHGLAIELAVSLGARTLHGGALGLVQDAKLDAGLIGHPAHEAV